MTLNLKMLLMYLFCATIIVSFNGLVESRKDKIKLKDIQVLTLKPNVYTTGRRSRPVPQLQCVGGYCDAIKGETVQCYNRGSDGIDIQWECKANIDSNYKFGSLDVICEGYDYPEDDYILVGSCGLEYRIDSVNKKGFSSNDNSFSPLKSKPSNGFSIGFIVCLCVLIFIIYYTCLRSSNVHNQSTRSGVPPPPPGFRSDFFGNPDGCSSSSSGGFTEYTNPREQRNTNNGFFSGLLAGGTLGYLFGSRNDTNYRNQSSYFGRRTSPSYFSEPETQSSTSSSSTKTTTSGFGGTKRR